MSKCIPPKCYIPVPGPQGIPGRGLAGIVETVTPCGVNLKFVSTDPNCSLPTIPIGRRARVVQTAHGLGPVGAFVPVRVIPGVSAQWVLAQANLVANTADFMAEVIDLNTFDILETGFHQITTSVSLGVNLWFALASATAGGVVPTTDGSLTFIQALFFKVSNSCVFVDVTNFRSSSGAGGLAIVDNQNGTYTFTQNGIPWGTINVNQFP